MIKSTDQLKAKIRNLANGDFHKAQALLRVYFMERLMERVSLSSYKQNFVFKGGVIVSSLLGLEMRTTVDIDTTVKKIPLLKESFIDIVSEILAINLDDSVSFTISKCSDIQIGREYPGIRFCIDCSMNGTKQQIQIDFSTGDIVTPGPISYEYKLMFEDRYITLFSYNVETILAEKLHAILSNAFDNTRMKDFYDYYHLTLQTIINKKTLKEAIWNTFSDRENTILLKDCRKTLQELKNNPIMKERWIKYVNDRYFVLPIEWEKVINQISNYLISTL